MALFDRLFRGGGSEISTFPIKRLNELDDPFILDVREPREIQRGKIPGAHEIPLGEIATRYAELPADRTIYIVCRSGNRSATACRILNAKGLSCVNLTGGMRAYRGPLA